jgi:hypothetical protein
MTQPRVHLLAEAPGLRVKRPERFELVSIIKRKLFPLEQAILRVARECRLAGFSMRRVAAELNRRGYVTRRGSQFQHQHVCNLLAA